LLGVLACLAAAPLRASGASMGRGGRGPGGASDMVLAYDNLGSIANAV
jgi:hypothetical protein